MLYILVNSDTKKVFLATYDENRKNEVTVYEEIEENDD